MGRHGTIAGRKAAQDSKRAAMFTKYARAIMVAAKAGGDPEYNPTLQNSQKLKPVKPRPEKNQTFPAICYLQYKDPHMAFLVELSFFLFHSILRKNHKRQTQNTPVLRVCLFCYFFNYPWKLHVP